MSNNGNTPAQVVMIGVGNRRNPVFVGQGVALPVGVQPRACLGVARLAITTGAAVSLTTASGGIPIPAGAVTAELQADGGSVRLRRDATSPTASLGYRLDDGAEKVVDSDLAAVRLIAQTVACAVNVAYFDKV